MTFLARFLGLAAVAGIAGLLIALTGCGGGSGSSTPPVTLVVSLGSTNVVVPQDGTSVQVPVTITGATGSPTVTVSGLPAGVTQQFATASGGPSGTLTFTGRASAEAGSYSPIVLVSLAGQNATQSFTLVSAVVATVGNATDTTLGVDGVLKQFMSTSFQIGGWTTDYFGSGATETALEATLNQLGPQHIRVQVVAGAIPMVSNTGTANDWDFTLLDTTLQPVLETADHSPELQVAVAPAWMCKSDGVTLDVANHASDFAAMMANIVRYYNKGGFDAGGTHFQSPGSYPIQWWGIFNEFNGNGLSGADYVKLYNITVPAMLAVDPTIKLSAFEFSDWGLDTGDGGDPMVYLPPFLAPANAGGVNTQVDIISTHFYSSCDQKNTDVQLFATIPQFVANVQYFYQALQARPDLAGVPVWVTENNVNADWSNNGMSVCNPGQVFVDDHRGTSAFFAAWRPYVFSQLGKAGNRALYHWSYTADQQYGEVDGSGNTFLSYWVDKTLTSLYPSTAASPGPKILKLNATDTSTVETLATQNSSGTVTVMIADRAVASPTDNNGTGSPRTVVVDLSSLGSFTSASLLTIDAATSASAGPTAVSVTPAARMNVTLPGYGVAFLTLTP
ncbi:MAG: hypothetical protein ABSC48_15175 [Terracidiphilus sp.]|jgi:hypothetical protein